jgi:hypothetical protein
MENQINQIIENEENNEPIIYTAEKDYLPLIIGELLTNESMDWGKIQDEINKNVDEYGLTPIAICKKSSYTQAHKKAQQRYREKFPEKYNDAQRKLYDDKKKDEEWKQKFNERSRLNNQKYREKKKKEIIESGGMIKGKGRPRKIKPEIIDVPIMNIDNIELKDEIVIIDEPEEKPKRKYVKKVKKTLENNI